MGLKAIEEQRLQRAGFIKFFDKERKHYKELAADAYNYTAKILQPTGLPVRVDDVAGHLSAALEVDKLLTDYRDGNQGTSAAYWVKYFTNLVLDRLWSEISNG